MKASMLQELIQEELVIDPHAQELLPPSLHLRLFLKTITECAHSAALHVPRRVRRHKRHVH